MSFLTKLETLPPMREQKSTPKIARSLLTLFSHACATFRHSPSEIKKKKSKNDPPFQSLCMQEQFGTKMRNS